MRRLVCLALGASLSVGAMANWSDDFDSYSNGDQLHGLGGWAGWDNSSAAGALVSNAHSASSPNSAEIAAGSDLTHQFTGATSGPWAFLGKVYIPTAYTGSSYFIMLNTYNHGGPYNWSVQLHFDGDTNTATDDNGTATPVAFARDTWMDFRVDIDLDNDSRTVSLDGNVVSTGSWTGGSGALNVGAIDLFGNGAGNVYYDDLALVPEPTTICALALGALALRRRRK